MSARIKRLLLLTIPAITLFFVTSIASAKGPSVAILPWKLNAPPDLEYLKDAMGDMLSTRLGSGEIDIIRPDIVRGAISNIKTTAPDSLAVEVGKKLTSGYVIYGSITVIGNSVSLDAKVLNVSNNTVTAFSESGAGLDSVVGLTDKLSSEIIAALSPKAPEAKEPVSKPALIPPTPPIPVPAPIPPATPGAREEGLIILPKAGTGPVLWKSAPIEGIYLSFVNADLDRDGVKEYFLLKSTGVAIAKIKDGTLDIVKDVSAGAGTKYIAISTIDSDADGSPEVYVSGIKDNKPVLALIEYMDKAYNVTVTGVPWLTRTIVGEDGKTVLIGQGFRFKDAFYGGIKVLKKEGGKVVEKGVFLETLPKRLDLYRFDVFNFNPGGAPGANVVALDDRDYVRVYRKTEKGWEEVWKSPDFFGGSLNLVEFTDDGKGAAPDAEPIAIRGRFFHEDLNRDGRPELIIKKNVPGGLGRVAETARSFVSGAVFSFSFDGGFLTENWRTKDVPGYVADFFIEEPGEDGARDVRMLIVEGAGAFSGSAKSYILSSRLPL